MTTDLFKLNKSAKLERLEAAHREILGTWGTSGFSSAEVIQLEKAIRAERERIAGKDGEK